MKPLSQESAVPVDIATVGNTNHEDEQLVISNLIDDAVIADPDSIKPVLAGKRSYAVRARVIAQSFCSILDAHCDISGSLRILRAAAGMKLNA